ncbi:helix-turn-helix domain-containing protein [Anaerostipes faecalis]|uniref:helix-turn-helix domain-containing protein n=1 Tax=Anaerostipes faecalis TaxID=2738446 RepID=UPI003F026383
MLTRFGKQLRKLRIDREERLKDMADRLNVTTAYLSAVENGKRTVPDAWVYEIIDTYHLDDNEARELQRAAYENKSDLTIGLNNTENIEVALSFARKFRKLTIKQANELQKMLDKM